MPEISEFDQEFTTEGSAGVETEKLEALIQQNLSPEEQNFMEQAKPIVAQFMGLLQKATGQNPEDLEETSSINPQGVPLESVQGAGVPQQSQTQPMVPPRPVQEQSPQNAPQMAALGGEMVQPMQRPAEQEAGQVAAGPVGVVNTKDADKSGTADDVPAESDGFVINAAAVRKIGVRKLYDLIEEAITYLEEKGVKLDTSKIPVDAEKILVSKGEVIIPDVIAAVIGYDKLEEINGVGTEETKEILAEQPKEKNNLPPIIQEAAEGLDVQHDGSRERLLPKDPDRENQMDLMQRQIEKNKPVTETLPKTDPVIETLPKTDPVTETLPKTDYVEEDNVKAPDFVPMETGDRPTPEVKYFGYTPDQLYDATAKHEWRGDTPKFSFVKVGEGFSPAGKSSAFGPVQIVKRTLTDPEFVKLLSDTEQGFVDKITAAQTLNINLQLFDGSASRSVSTEEGPKGRAALEVLGITPQEFIQYVKEGYFLPSNKSKQEQGIPPELLPDNAEKIYKNIYKRVLQLKSLREESNTLKGLLGSYYGHEDDSEKENYANSVIENLQ